MSEGAWKRRYYVVYQAKYGIGMDIFLASVILVGAPKLTGETALDICRRMEEQAKEKRKGANSVIVLNIVPLELFWEAE